MSTLKTHTIQHTITHTYTRYKYVHMHTHTHTHTHTRTHTHTHTHRHTHTQPHIHILSLPHPSALAPYVSGSAKRICFGVTALAAPPSFSDAPCVAWTNGGGVVVVGEGVDEGERVVGVAGRGRVRVGEVENPNRFG